MVHHGGRNTSMGTCSQLVGTTIEVGNAHTTLFGEVLARRSYTEKYQWGLDISNNIVHCTSSGECML